MTRPALFPALHDRPVRHAISTSFISPEVAVRSAGRFGCLREAVLEECREGGRRRGTGIMRTGWERGYPQTLWKWG